jgi:hypothetical protein
MVIDRAAECEDPRVDALAGGRTGKVPRMAKLLYKPFAIVLGIVTAKVAGSLFNVVWARLDRNGDGTVPGPTERDADTRRAIAASAVQAATFAGTRTAVDRFGLRVFYHLTGLWAGTRSAAEEAARAEKKAARKAKKDKVPVAS